MGVDAPVAGEGADLGLRVDFCCEAAACWARCAL